LRISGLAEGSLHGLPCQTLLGTGPITVAIPVATSRAKSSLRVTSSVLASSALKEAIRSTSSRPT
jgi:hypothetical protein